MTLSTSLSNFLLFCDPRFQTAVHDLQARLGEIKAAFPDLASLDASSKAAAVLEQRMDDFIRVVEQELPSA